MANILLTGIATLDIINHVAYYPTENEEIRALEQTFRRGGNAANTSDILSQLGHKATLVCTLAKDSSAQFIRSDLNTNNINLLLETPPNALSTPTSYITLSKTNGSRTIVHHRDLDELSFNHFDAINLAHYDWLHFEGRNIKNTCIMMNKSKILNKPVSVEIEKIRSDGDIYTLFPLADIIMLSKPFSLSQGFTSAADCLHHFSSLFPDKVISCTWGNKGAWIIKNDNIYHSPAHSPGKTIDVIGAGDTFNAALIDALIRKQPVNNALHIATKLAGLKCTQSGFKNLVSATNSNLG